MVPANDISEPWWPPDSFVSPPEPDSDKRSNPMRTAILVAAAALSLSSLARADESLLNSDPFAAAGAKQHTADIKAAMHGDDSKLREGRHDVAIGRQESHSSRSRITASGAGMSRERSAHR